MLSETGFVRGGFYISAGLSFNLLDDNSHELKPASYYDRPKLRLTQKRPTTVFLVDQRKGYSNGPVWK